LQVRETLFPALPGEAGKYALVCGELSAPAGKGVAVRELKEAHSLLAEGGEALILVTEKQEWEWLQGTPNATILLRREGACVLRISRARG